jgi:hypothetical protein
MQQADLSMITKTKQAKKTRPMGTFAAQAKLQAFRKSPKYKTFSTLPLRRQSAR